MIGASGARAGRIHFAGDRPGTDFEGESTMRDWLGKHISEICGNGYTADNLNHCAHFVSHALQLNVGYTCKAQTGGASDGACIRVHELFRYCKTVGNFTDRPAGAVNLLVFITNPANVQLASKIMVNHPRKHVGVLFGDVIIHYSNTKDKVVEQSFADFGKHYAAPFNGMFYGTI